ncbi:PAS domain S-box protein [Demequina sp. SO4-18]|uniref:hybrid sensor histidine kinase/response regulator n=1 Tax=Demequina sp. SO4-18 TaxID=3401026 RepID=UPI003B58E2C9
MGTAAVAGMVAVIAMTTDQPSLISILAVVAMLIALIIAAASARSRRADTAPQRTSDTRAMGAVDAARRVSRIGTWSYDYDTQAVTWSDEVADIHGRPAGHQPTDDESVAYFIEGDRERLTAAISSAIERVEPFIEECEIDAADGARRSILIIGEPVIDDSGRPLRLHGTIQDLTAWREAEWSAESQRRRFTQLTSALPLAVWSADADGVVDYISEALADYSGRNVEDLLGDDWLTLLHPDDREMMKERWATALAAQSPYEAECRVRHHQGDYRWHSVSAKPEYDDQGHVTRWWGSSIDIHHARTLEEKAMQLARDRDVILDSISDGVLVIDKDWRISYMNDRVQEMSGRARESLVGKEWWAEYPDMLGTPVQEAYEAAMTAGAPQFLTFYDEARSRWFEITATPSSLGITVFFRDITHARELGERLEQAQRLESVGRLTGGIAHDFNNLLTVVIGGADAVSLDDGISPGSRDMVALVRQAAERGAELTGRLLAFARRQPLAPQHTDINSLLEGFEPLLRRTLGDEITVETALAPELPAAHVDPSQFESAVLNLAINARDAMPEGGSLILETELRHLDEAYVTSHAEVTPGSYVVVTVTDSGTGIAPEALDQLFDPFFTTKPVGHGSGMGLAMVWGFARQTGGHVTVYSEVGHGTSFRLYLPLAPGTPATAVPKRDTDAAPARGSGVILLAEDDPLVRAFATGHLRSLGYDVVASSTGPEALEQLAQMDTVDLLFTDVIMPEGMTGRDLAERVVAARPGTPVLYASGYTENVIMHNGKLDEGVALLAKPYSAQELAVRVHEQMFEAAREDT